MVDATLALPAETRLMVLAPVVRDRKGEFAELFEQMQAQGYVRFRVDGRTVEAADVPTLKLKKAEKHDIDVVIDRIKVQPHGDAAAGAPLRQRLAESFEAALRIADGRALAVEMDGAGATEHLYSSKFALPALRLLAARARAAPVLVQLAGRRVPDLRRPRRDDGVRRRARRRLPVAQPRERRDQGLGPAQSLHLLACSRASPATTGSTSTRRSRSCRKRRARCCCAAREPKRSSSSTRPRARAASRASSSAAIPFEGILPNLERRLRETESAAVREELVRAAEREALPRLPRHAAARRSEERLPGRRRRRQQGADLPRRALHLARGARLVRAPVARGREGRDRRQGDPRDRLAAQVPERRRPELPQPRPQRRDALGRRGAADPARVADRLGPDRRHVRPRRAVDRPAPARQRAPDRHALSPARHRQQRDRRRARRGGDPRRRPRDRHGPGRRRPRRARSWPQGRPTTSPPRPSR